MRLPVLLLGMTFSGLVCAAPAGAPLATGFTKASYGLNNVGIPDREPSEKKPGVIRILYVDGSWGLPPRQTIARRLEYHLLNKASRPFEVINGEFLRDTVGEVAEKIGELMKAYRPDFVYYRPRPAELVYEAAARAGDSMRFREFLAVDPGRDTVFARAAQLQWGALILGRRLSSKFHLLTEITSPAVAAIGKIKMEVERNGAKFRLITAAIGTNRSTWTLRLPPEARALSLAEVLKYRPLVTHAQWTERIRDAGIEVIDAPDLRIKPLSPQMADEAAAIFAQRILDL